MRQTAKQLNRKKFLEIEIIGLKLGHFMGELICSIYSFFCEKNTNLFTSKFKQRNCRCSGHNGNKS